MQTSPVSGNTVAPPVNQPPRKSVIDRSKLPTTPKTEKTGLFDFMLNGCFLKSDAQRKREAENILTLFNGYNQQQLETTLPEEETDLINQIQDAIKNGEEISVADLADLKDVAKKYDEISLAQMQEASEKLKTRWPKMQLNEIEWKGDDTVNLIDGNIAYQQIRYVKLLIKHFKKNTLKYSVETGIFSSNLIEGNELHSILDLLVQKKIIEAQAVEVLNKFYKSKFLTREEFDTFHKAYNDVLAPLACAVHKPTFEFLEEDLAPQPLAILTEFKENPFSITSSGLKKLKAIQTPLSDAIQDHFLNP